MWRAIRWPVVTLAIGGALVLLAQWIDAGPREIHEWSLPVAAVAFFIVLPGATVWLVVALILYRVGQRRRRT